MPRSGSLSKRYRSIRNTAPSLIFVSSFIQYFYMFQTKIPGAHEICSLPWSTLGLKGAQELCPRISSMDLWVCTVDGFPGSPQRSDGSFEDFTARLAANDLTAWEQDFVNIFNVPCLQAVLQTVSHLGSQKIKL